MRIVAGSLGGRRLKAPAGHATRPTPERVREALFSILGPPEPQTRVLDPFAGAGTLGLEALSRGAAELVLVDSARTAIHCLRENVASLGVTESTQIHQGDALRIVAKLTGRFDWVFVDPPYKSDLAERLLELLADSNLLTSRAMIVVEHDCRQAPALSYGNLRRTDHRRYGDTELSFYQPGEQSE